MHRALTLALFATACGGGTVDLDVPLTTQEEYDDACDDPELEKVEQSFTLTFTEDTAGCDWEQDGNLARRNGYLMARAEQVLSLEVPENVVLCDLEVAFGGVGNGETQEIVYDDNFFLTFNDVLLATSWSQMVGELPVVDGFPTYSWDAIVEKEIDWNDMNPWCLGQDEGLSDCSIPPSEQQGPISLSFDDSIISKLSFGALEQRRFDYAFITTGDNDDSDCQHLEFTITVTAPAIVLGEQ